MAKVNYLNNKDILREIQKSKASYSSFVDKKYEIYDAVVQNIEDITPELIDSVKEKRIKKMVADDRQRQKDEGKRNHQITPLTVSKDEIPEDELVFRVMTWDHIPDNAHKRAKTKADSDDYVKLMFAPFKHYIIKDGEFVEVGRSHWHGGLQNGYFSQEHGKMTNELCRMFLKLVERYGQRGNWRGYCVDETTQALTKRGWLDIDQITEDDQIMSYKDGHMVWSDIEYIYRGEFEGNLFHLHNENIDSLITPEHRILLEDGSLVKIEDTTKEHIAKLIAKPSNTVFPEQTMTDIEMMECLDTSFTTDFVLRLTKDQVYRAIKYLAHGRFSGTYFFNDVPEKMIEPLTTLITLHGTKIKVSNGNFDILDQTPTVALGEALEYSGTPIADHSYNGRVWCPKTAYGVFLAKRNNTVFLTGNTYLDEMRQRALLQLIAVGLQFDESRSEIPNPFSYYTVVVQNAFTSVLNQEKKNQNIRDDILTMAGATPSSTRQIEIEINQRHAEYCEDNGIKPSDALTPLSQMYQRSKATLKSKRDREAKEARLAEEARKKAEEEAKNN